MPDFKYAIIGRGLMGSAAARHLAEQVDGVALIGPEEPANWQTHDGVFSSHYDEGRITRTIDPDVNWARLANRSISRYRDIEARSGVQFYTERGSLLCGIGSGPARQYVADIGMAARRLGVEALFIDDFGLKSRFPFFSFPEGSEAVFEPLNAGYISPRKLVEAQSILTETAGGTIFRERVVSLAAAGGGVEIRLADGRLLKAEKALVAAGGFTNAPGLLPQPLDLTVYGRTVAFFEVSSDEAARFSTMPSMIFKGEDVAHGIYMLPPILYPDGKYYLKIGGDIKDLALSDFDAVRNWFRSGRDEENYAHLVRMTNELVPSLAFRSIHRASCVTSFTSTQYPAIGWTGNPAIAVMTGGCGAAAKSSDEIGRLGAELLLRGNIADEDYDADFVPRFRR